MDIAFEGESGESTEGARGGVIPGKKAKNHLERACTKLRTKSPPHAFGINLVWCNEIRIKSNVEVGLKVDIRTFNLSHSMGMFVPD